MDLARFKLRPFEVEDYPALARVVSVASPKVPWSAEGLRHEDETRRSSGLTNLRYLIEDTTSQAVVGVGELGESPYQHHPGKLWVNVTVLPEFRRRGLGRTMYDHLIAEARRRNTWVFRAVVDAEEPEGNRFALERGFREQRRVWQSALEVASARTDGYESVEQRLLAGGIRFTTLAEEGADDPRVVRGLYELETAAAADIPRSDSYTPPSLDEYRARTMGSPELLPQAWFLAKDRDRYVGLSYAQLLEGRPDSMLQRLTCTLREYRRKGIAFALKARLIQYARQNRLPWIRTFNDSLNDPMWRLNERLGFRREATYIHYERAQGTG